MRFAMCSWQCNPSGGNALGVTCAWRLLCTERSVDDAGPTSHESPYAESGAGVGGIVLLSGTAMGTFSKRSPKP